MTPTTTSSRPHHAATRATRPTRDPGHQSSAFLAEIRQQWALTTALLDDAMARGDDGAQQEAVDRLDELRELLWRHDLSLDVLRLAARPT